MQSHYPDVKVIQTSQGCQSTEKRKIYPGQSVSPPSARGHYEDETSTLESPRLVSFYLTGVGLKSRNQGLLVARGSRGNGEAETVNIFLPPFTEGGSYGISRKNRAFWWWVFWTGLFNIVAYAPLLCPFTLKGGEGPSVVDVSTPDIKMIREGEIPFNSIFKALE